MKQTPQEKQLYENFKPGKITLDGFLGDDTRHIHDIIEDTALSDDERSYLPGKAGATIPLAGMVNSTTDAILGPLMGNRTSITKTIEYRAYATNSTGSVGSFYNGEVYLTNIEYSGNLVSLQTFSVDATFDGAVNRTSAEL